jgi:hypothetical protein
MTKTNLSTASLCAAVVAVAGFLSASEVQASDFTTAGTECVSNNLQQALNSPIIWDNWRVRNANPSLDRFVLCPIAHYTDADETGGTRTILDGTIRITGWFGPDAATDAEIVCGVREIPNSDAGAPTSGDSVAITMQAGGTVPNVDQTSVNLAGTGVGVVGVPLIAACRLPPGTGIQQLGVNLNR